MDEWIGRVLGERFRLDELIGRGGYGAVYRGVQLSIDRPVAIKLLHPHVAERPTVLKRFEREARLISKLRHPGAVQVVDFGQAEGTLFLAMEFVDGPTLRSVLRERGPLPSAEVAALGARVADALATAHEIGVIHRDLKSSNILLTELGGRPQPVVIDFGLARLVADDLDAEHSDLTASNMLIGTPAYMSPEAVVGEELDGRSDLYSLGIVLYELLAGSVPLRGATPIATATLHVTTPIPPVDEVSDGAVHPALARLVARLVEKLPEQRPESAEVVANALREIAGSLEGPAHSAEGPANDASSSALSSEVTDDLRSPRRPASPGDSLFADSLQTRAPQVGPGAAAVDAGGGSNSSLATDPTIEQTSARGPSRSTRPPARRRVVALFATAAVGAAVLALVFWNGRSSVPLRGMSSPSSSAWTLDDGPAESAADEASRERVVAARAPGADDADTSEDSAPPRDETPAAEPQRTERGTDRGSHSRSPTRPMRANEPEAHAETSAGAAAQPPPAEPSAQRSSAPSSSASRVEPAELSVFVDPHGVVYLDGRRLGESPILAFELEPGDYQIESRYADQVRTESIILGAGEARRIRHTFTR